MLGRQQRQSEARRVTLEASLEAWLSSDAADGLGARIECTYQSWLRHFSGTSQLILGLGGQASPTDLAACTGFGQQIRETRPVFAKNVVLPFATASLDLVMLNFALDLAPHPARVLQEVGRVLAPGGRLLIAGLNLYSLECSLRHFMDTSVWMRSLRPLSCFQLRQLLQQADLVPDEIRTLNRLPPKPNSPLRHLSAWAEARLLGVVYLVDARKEKLEPIHPERMLCHVCQNLAGG